MERSQLALLVSRDLEVILARTRAAYVERVPRLKDMPPDLLEKVLEATRRGMRHFLRYYVEGTLDRESWRHARDATIDRAGEVFTREEILEFITIARAVTTEALHHLAETHPDLPAEERERIAFAMDGYVSELALQEDALRPPAAPGDIDLMLSDLEAEGADLQ